MDQAEPCVCADLITNTFEIFRFSKYIYGREKMRWKNIKNMGNLIGNREWMDENVEGKNLRVAR